MKFYWIKTPSIIKRLFYNQVWDIPNSENKIYLTFDDGPIPEVTNWVLEILKEHNIKVTFFCVGENIKNNPTIFEKILFDGHAVGNHTFNHLNGWKNPTQDYLENIKKCNEQLFSFKSKFLNLNSNIFRPPYGKIKKAQSRKLRQLGFKIIMWDLLSADFDATITPEKCLENVVNNVKSGSIIVFHDHLKAFKNLEYTLPRAIEILKKRGFVFDVLS